MGQSLTQSTHTLRAPGPEAVWAVSENVGSGPTQLGCTFWLSSGETLDKWLFKDQLETILFYLSSVSSCASPLELYPLQTLRILKTAVTPLAVDYH